MAKEKKLNKAGVVIYGTNADGKRTFVVPYTEGRFGDNHKFYALPIGTIDPDDKTAYAAALRETHEETGIDMKLLLGAEAYEAYSEGKPVQASFDSPGYPGVRIVHIGTEAATHTYLSRVNSPKHCALFGIEVEGIENLAWHLKNRANNGTYDHKVRHPIRRTISNPNVYPPFNDLLEWLRDGKMPERAWNTERLERLGIPAPEPLYKNSEMEENPFVRLEKKIMDGQHITSPQDLKTFCNRLSISEDQEMGVYFEKIKHALSDLKIVDDTDVLKVDDKDTPLQFFQEGADILTAGEYLEQCSARIKDTPDYALAFGGKGALTVTEQQHIVHSQLAAISSFIPPRELLDVATNSLLLGRDKEVNGVLELESEHPDDLAAMLRKSPAFQGDHLYHPENNYWSSRTPYKPFDVESLQRLHDQRLQAEAYGAEKEKFGRY